MSWTNNTNSFANNRTSIFEMYHTPSFGDEEFEVSSAPSADTMRNYSHIMQPSRKAFDSSPADEANTATDDVQFVMSPANDEETEAMATLWMSCSPGRDSEREDEEEEEEEEEEEDDEDDCIPLSRLQTSKGLKLSSSDSVLQKKKLKKERKDKLKTRKKKDPNAPKKSMSAYSLFFRDTQASIKSQNATASFGEISRIVAQMWDTLQPHEKEKYNKQADHEKQVYLKALADYEAGKHKASNQRPGSQKSKHKPSHAVVESEGESDKDDPAFVLSGEESSDSEKEAARPSCTRPLCQNAAIADPRWDSDFCSEQCVVLHCRDVFTAWVASRQTAKVE